MVFNNQKPVSQKTVLTSMLQKGARQMFVTFRIWLPHRLFDNTSERNLMHAY